jgi:hypothetical protein
MKTGKVNEKGVSSRRGRTGIRRGGLRWVSRDGTGWRLPSGEELAEFAVHAGFVAPALLPGAETRVEYLSEESETVAGGAGYRRRISSREEADGRVGGYR